MVKLITAVALSSLAITARPDVPFGEGMVTITLDDSIVSQYTVARPELNARGFRATYFLTTSNMAYSGFMTPAQAREIAADGHEIGSHSVQHLSLPALPDLDLAAEVGDARLALMRDLALPEVTSYAVPFGDYSDRVLNEIERHYTANRTMLDWHNFADTDPMMLRTFTCETTSTLDWLKAKVDQAIADRSWAIFLFHELTDAPPTWRYACSSNDFKALLDHIQTTRVKVVTIREGRALLAAQRSAVPFDLTWSAPSVPAGEPSTGTVRLSGRAPPGGIVLQVSSDRPKLASGPQTITVPAASSTASFTMTTAGVATRTDVRVSVGLGRNAATRVLTIEPSGLAPVSESDRRSGGCSTARGAGSGGALLLVAAAAIRRRVRA